MRAAILHGIGEEKLELRDDVTVIGPGPGEVKIRVAAAGVCHSDLSARSGLLPQPVPAVLGHEAAGEVVEIGDGVTTVEVGDHVIANWLPACGACLSCLRGAPYLCIAHVMMGYVQPRFMFGDTPAFAMAGCGAFAEEIVVVEPGAVKIGKDVPLPEAALVGCAVMTGVGAVINTAKVPAGSTVVVIGCGGVGLSTIQGARIAGAEVIVAVDVVPAKREAALRFGATHAVAPDELSGLSTELTGGEGFDYAFDVVGSARTLRAGWVAVRRGGQVILVGAGSAEEQVDFSPFELLFEGKQIVGSLYGSADAHRDYPQILDFWRQGQLDLEGMISHRLSLDDVNDALDALGRGDVLRQVIVHDRSV